jgi:predicted nucleic acid-binding protein
VIWLDTNVISALMRREPDPLVVSWLDGQDAFAKALFLASADVIGV